MSWKTLVMDRMTKRAKQMTRKKTMLEWKLKQEYEHVILTNDHYCWMLELMMTGERKRIETQRKRWKGVKRDNMTRRQNYQKWFWN